MDRKECLNTAEGLITGQRAIDYGDARENHQRIASFWSTYLCKTLTPADVANMMMLLKIARIMETATDDSYIDICGYAAIGCEVTTPKPKTPQEIGPL
tara:strand:- start:1040 stop:1333 length:294 start_codon:yes stop_codon:yes gene_type:complete